MKTISIVAFAVSIAVLTGCSGYSFNAAEPEDTGGAAGEAGASAGSGGDSGSGGSITTGGSGGSAAGTGGYTAGTGGYSGIGGSAGSSGNAGTSGYAGTGGTSGSSGSGGTAGTGGIPNVCQQGVSCTACTTCEAMCQCNGGSTPICTSLCAPPGTGGASGSGGSSGTGGTNSTGGSGGTTSACTPGDCGACATCEAACACLGYTGQCGQFCGTAGSGGTGGTAGTGGTSGSSGSGGATSTGGTGGTGGSGATFKKLTITFDTVSAMSNFSFTHMSDAAGYFFSGQACDGAGSARICTVDVDPTYRWDFWAYTGATGDSQWSPGLNWNTNACASFAAVQVKEGSSTVPFRMENVGSGCHFVIEYGASDSSDSDGDGSPDSSDCKPHNPSALPGGKEVCGNGLDEDCSNGDAFCGGGSGGSGGTGGSSGSGGSGGSSGGSNLTDMTFDVFGQSASGTFLAVAPAFQSANCSSQSLKDPVSNSWVGAARCQLSVDRSQNLEFNVQVNGTWATGYSTPGNCQKYLRVYAWTNFCSDSNQSGCYAAADYDDSSSTSFPQQMWHEYANSTCHVFLPKL